MAKDEGQGPGNLLYSVSGMTRHCGLVDIQECTVNLSKRLRLR